MAFVEAVSAVSRRTFVGEITEEQGEEVWTRVVADFAGYAVVEPEPRLVKRAAELTRRYRLRALDAIHLASGLAARRQAPASVDFRFASADRRLNVAATAELFEVFNPGTPVPPGTATPVTPFD
jgi:predicted nucleic acid-binding protein